MRDCSVESEHPQGGGFGEAALRAARRARVENAVDPAGPIPLGRILYRTNFVLDGYQTREDEQRRREQRQRDREARARQREVGD